MRAAIGPCICVRHYEFGADALAPLVERFGEAVAAPPSTGSSRRLPRALRLALDDAGVDEVTERAAARSSRPTTTRTVGTAAPVARPSSW